MKHINVQSDNTFRAGMNIRMADKSESYPVSYVPDVEYVRRGDIPLYLQLLLPHGQLPDSNSRMDAAEESDRAFPLVIFIQGSAWGEQDVYRQIPQLVPVARQGFVVASVQYRSSTLAKFPAFLQDVKSAIRFLRANAQKYHINPRQVAVWGNSSGGHAALLTGFTADMPEFKTSDYCEYSDGVDAVIDFYGPTDVTRINDYPREPGIASDVEHIPENLLYGGNVIEHPELARPGNPLNYVSPDKKLPPVLIVHGDQDGVVPFNQSVLIYDRLVECHQNVQFYKVCGAGHGTYFWTEEVLDLVEHFLKAYVH